ncbi:hypothetical protein DN595_26720 [Enterobacter cloacae]|uniref:Uncharacterized protein n=1 Tax=Enterobacter cloacae TaxID=550 RepID=A0AB37VB22_ENTCL|nr:hypothetical protein DN595_26720 [Enterobacter cloacae]
MVILVGLAIDQIAQSGLSSLSVIYYSAQLFRHSTSIDSIRLQNMPISLTPLSTPAPKKP